MLNVYVSIVDWNLFLNQFVYYLNKGGMILLDGI